MTRQERNQTHWGMVQHARKKAWMEEKRKRAEEAALRHHDPAARAAKLAENPHGAAVPVRETAAEKAANAQRRARRDCAIHVETGNMERRLREKRWRERSRDR